MVVRESARRALRVVVADDDAAFRRLVTGLLGPVTNVEVVGEAADGNEALHIVHATDADLVLLDIDMPHLDGLSAAERIRTTLSRVHIVLHGGHGNPQAHSRAARLGLTIRDKAQLHDTVAVIACVALAADPE